MKIPRNSLRHLIGLTLLVCMSLLALISYFWSRSVPTPSNKASSSNRANQPVFTPTPLRPDRTNTTLMSEAYGKLPLSFEANCGQTDSQVKFLSRGSGYSLFLTPTEVVLSLSKPAAQEKSLVSSGKGTDSVARETRSERAVLRMKLLGANPEPKPVGMDEISGKSNYFIGNDPKKWLTNITNYSKVKYESVYPGVDLIYYGDNRRIEYDFVVAPSAKPENITLSYQGAASLEVDARGNLILHTPSGDIRQERPTLYQVIDGVQREVSGGYALKGQQVSFRVSNYDTSKPLIIDPVLVYSTYLGGSALDFGYDIAVDDQGNAYVTGQVESTNFPLANPLQSTFAGQPYDGFVAKIDATGSALEYSTYLGGSELDFCQGISIDSSGYAYVTGMTRSSNFPVTSGAFQTVFISSDFCGSDGLGNPILCADAFVAKLSQTGSALVYSTYLGGTNFDAAHAIKVDEAGYVFVTGETNAGFPATPGAFQSGNGGQGGFVTKLDQTGSSLVYSAFLPGANLCQGIALDQSGNAYVTGRTSDTGFPTTLGAFQTNFGGISDAFVTKLNAMGTALVYSTFLGGTGLDAGFSIAVDSLGSAYVTGFSITDSRQPEFPTTFGAFQVAFGGGHGDFDAFVTKINATGSGLIYSTLLGGSGNDECTKIAVDDQGNAYVTGDTQSINFPTFNSFQSNLQGSLDAFITKVNPTGSGLIYSSYLGGSGGDQGVGLALDRSGNAYVIGATSSFDFPTLNPLQAVYRGRLDTFVAKIGEAPPTVTIISPSSGAIFAIGTTVNFTGNFIVNPSCNHSATWAFDNITQAGTVNETTGAVIAAQTFTIAGVYLVTLTVNDGCGGTGTANTVDGLTAMVVVYDPEGGFVTGGGWINSPAGAYTDDSTLTGRASFGFVSKYLPGATMPTGNTEFQFRVANFNFKSTSYNWLVVGGARAQYKGSGTVNGSGNYGFMLTAIDGVVNGSGGVDKFRIKIWNKNNNDAVVYDNKIGSSDNSNDATELAGGSIIIHR